MPALYLSHPMLQGVWATAKSFHSLLLQPSKKPGHWAWLKLFLPLLCSRLLSPLILHLDSFHDKKSLLDLRLNCTAVSLEAQTWKIITQCCQSCLSISKVTECRQRRSPGQRAEPCHFRCFREKRNCSQPACRFIAEKQGSKWVLSLHLSHSTRFEWEKKLSPLSPSENNLSSHSLGDRKKKKSWLSSDRHHFQLLWSLLIKVILFLTSDCRFFAHSESIAQLTSVFCKAWE